MNGKASCLSVTKSRGERGKCSVLNALELSAVAWQQWSKWLTLRNTAFWIKANDVAMDLSDGLSCLRKGKVVAGCICDTSGLHLFFQKECSKCLALALLLCKELNSNSPWNNYTLQNSNLAECQCSCQHSCSREHLWLLLVQFDEQLLVGEELGAANASPHLLHRTLATRSRRREMVVMRGQSWSSEIHLRPQG